MKRPRIAIRADAAPWIGSGHIQRCLTVAAALRERGADILFVCRELPGNLCSRIEEQGFSTIRLPPAVAPLERSIPSSAPHAYWLGVPLTQEIEDTAATLASVSPLHTLIVDHYGLEATWETALRPLAGQCLALDDLADRRHDCDLLLDPALREGPAPYAGLLPSQSRCLLGPRYALLRPQFSQLRSSTPPRSGPLARLLVFLGGYDPQNLTGRVVNVLATIAFPRGCKVDVVVGDNHPAESEIRSCCAQHPGWELHVATPEMPNLMARADIMIGTPGGTTWERCCLGLPSVLFTVADNQKENAREMARRRAAIVLPSSIDQALAQLPGVLLRLADRPALLSRLSRRARNLVDGQGARRTALITLASTLKLRPVTLADCEIIWRWRNDERTRRTAFNTAPVSLESHRAWFQNTLQNPQRLLLIGEIGEDGIGVLRYDRGDNQAVVSTYLDPELHGTGLGHRLIAAGNHWLADHCPDLGMILAHIRPENLSSQRAFTRAGFEPYRASTQEIVLAWHRRDPGEPD